MGAKGILLRCKPDDWLTRSMSATDKSGNSTSAPLGRE